MKRPGKQDTILLLSFGMATVFWTADALVDYLIHFDGPFMDILLPEGEELAFRLLVCASFLSFGLLISKLFAKQELTEADLRASEAKYRSLVESTEDSIYLVDMQCRYLYMNKKHQDRMGLTEKEYMGRPYSDFHTPEETRDFMEKVKMVFETGGSVQHEHRSRRDNRYFLRTLSPVRGDDWEITAITVVSKDITDRKELEEKLNSMLITDELTGLYNRRGFFALAQQQLKIASRTNRGVFLLYADLDSLKYINDTFGHTEGDRALMDTADIFRGIYRDSDIIARIGGDEFAIIPMDTSETDMALITGRLEQSVEKFNSANDRKYRLSISYGIVYYNPEFPCTIDELLIKADRLMYENKRNKQNS